MSDTPAQHFARITCKIKFNENKILKRRQWHVIAPNGREALVNRCLRTLVYTVFVKPAGAEKFEPHCADEVLMDADAAIERAGQYLMNEQPAK